MLYWATALAARQQLANANRPKWLSGNQVSDLKSYKIRSTVGRRSRPKDRLRHLDKSKTKLERTATLLGRLVEFKRKAEIADEVCQKVREEYSKRVREQKTQHEADYVFSV